MAKRLTTYSTTPSSKLLLSNKRPLTAIIGPVGSGKSTGAILTLIKRCSEQPLHNGVRRSRVCFVRRYGPELITTTLETFLQILPEAKMKFNYPIRGKLEFINESGDLVLIELLFLPVSNKEDTKRLRSLEITYGFIDEANQVPQDVLAVLQDRVGRYPPRLNGGCNDSGVIIATNAFTSDHWLRQFLYKDFEVISPPTGDYVLNDEVLLVRQPPAVLQFGTEHEALDFLDKVPRELIEKSHHHFKPSKSVNGFWFVTNPYADNLENLPINYYSRVIPTKTSHDINVNYMNHLMSDAYNDSACYPMFNPDTHIVDKYPDLIKADLIALGWDFGLTPACCVNAVYKNPEEPSKFTVYTIAEVYRENMGLERFVPEVIFKLHELGIRHDADTISYMDVAGQQRAQSNESTCQSVLVNNHFTLGGTITQNVVSRLEGVRNRLYADNGYFIHRDCANMITGLMGEYKFSETTAAKGILKPDKNQYSHLQDSLQYAMLGVLTEFIEPSNLEDF